MTSSTDTADSLQALQNSIGYQFNDENLLQQALTHKSHSKPNNERLEFMGDAVLGYLVGNMLYRHYPHVQEDSLSLMRAKLVRGKTLAQVAMRMDLAQYLKLGSGEIRSGGRQRASILADALEAIIGAVHEDGGIDQAQQLVQKLFGELTQGLDAESLKDPKTRLQELLQGSGIELPSYTVEQVSGADHQRQYTVKCEVPSLSLQAIAADSSRRAAEKAAAHEGVDTGPSATACLQFSEAKEGEEEGSGAKKGQRKDSAKAGRKREGKTAVNPVAVDGSQDA